MILKGSDYKVEILNAGWVHEVIMERFDNALDLLTPNAIVYGGAVRDCIANKELEGDLDISIPPQEFKTLSELFLVNPRWVDKRHDGRTPGNEGKIKLETGSGDSGDLARILSPMSAVTSLRNIDGQEVQLIQSKYGGMDPLESAIMVARMVDIVCCGIIMTATGEVFEVVPGAHQDCIDGVLRINKTSDTIYLDTLQSRVDKLTGRGWKNLINVEKTIKDIEKKRAKDGVTKKPEDEGKSFVVSWRRRGYTRLTCIVKFRNLMPLSAVNDLCLSLRSIARDLGISSDANVSGSEMSLNCEISPSPYGKQTIDQFRRITEEVIRDTVRRTRPEKLSPTMRVRDVGKAPKLLKARFSLDEYSQMYQTLTARRES